MNLALALLLLVMALLAAFLALTLWALWAGALINWLLPLEGEAPLAAAVRSCGRRFRWLLPPDERREVAHDRGQPCRCPWKRDGAPMHLAWCPRAGLVPPETRR